MRLPLPKLFCSKKNQTDRNVILKPFFQQFALKILASSRKLLCNFSPPPIVQIRHDSSFQVYTYKITSQREKKRQCKQTRQILVLRS